MIRIITFITAILAAPIAQAGDYLEGYYLYVVGSIPSTIPVEEMTDVAAPEFRNTISALSDEWSEKCGVNVSIWHTNLMGNEADDWTPDYWFAFIAMEETKAAAISVAPATDCASQGYIKQGNMLIPGLYYICVMPEDDPELFEQVCNNGETR